MATEQEQAELDEGDLMAELIAAATAVHKAERAQREARAARDQLIAKAVNDDGWSLRKVSPFAGVSHNQCNLVARNARELAGEDGRSRSP